MTNRSLIRDNKTRSVDAASNSAIDSRKTRRLIIIFSDQMKAGDPWCRSLEAYGYKVSLSANPEAMSGGPLQFKPEAIVVDLRDEGAVLKSLTTLARLREEARLDIPVVFIGDRKDFRLRVETVRAGVASFLDRPVTPLALVECLDSLTSTQQAPYRVLLVDDSRTQSKYMKRILSEAGMETRVVNDIQGVMRPLEEFRPEIIIMDLNMPEVSGDEVVSVIRQEQDYATIPIVYVSGETDEQRRSSAMRRGGDDFISKPFDVERFIDSVSHRVKRFRQLRELVEKDSLTGLVNHSHTFRIIDHWFEKAHQTQVPCSYAIFDIDYFKKVNDTFGHDTGDQVIKSLSRCLRERTRNLDVAGRIGGEEFAFIMPETDISGAAEVTEWLRDEFSEIIHASGDESFACTVSVGVAAFDDYRSELEMRNAADEAMYRSKAEGRNRVTVASPASDQMAGISKS